MRTYGKRGGTGPNTGKKQEILVDPVGGGTVRVFKGQRWLSVIQQHEHAPQRILAHHSKQEAEAYVARAVQYMERDLEQWQVMNQQRHIWRALPPDPPYGRPDVEYVVEAKVQK